MAIMMDRRKLFVFVVVWMYLNAVNPAENCTCSIDFREMDSNRTVEVVKNTDVVLQFYLASTCNISDRLSITVSKARPTTVIRDVLCRIWPGKDHHVTQASNCIHKGMETYELRRTVQLNDGGDWIWRINTEPHCETKVHFKIIATTVTTAADIRGVSAVVSSVSNRAPDANGFTHSPTTLAITTGETGETSEAPDSKQVVNLTVVLSVTIAVTIAAVAATLITFRFVSVMKGRNNNDIQPEPRVQAVRDEEGQGQDAENTPAYHYYWEIQDDALSGAPAFSCQAPATPPDARECLADGYMTPVASRAVVNNTDGARNVIPMYHNSRGATQKEATASDVTATDRIMKETQCDADGYLIPVKTGNTRSKHSLHKNASPK